MLTEHRTKVGMLNRRRDKPLLTYGRRSSTPEAPASKKRKTTHEPSPLTTPNEPSKEEESPGSCSGTSELAAPSSSVAKEAREEPDGESVDRKVKKGSIMSFFKPVSPKDKAGGSRGTKEMLDEEADEESAETQAPEPTTKRRRKGPRLLRLKPSLPSHLPDEDKENDEPSVGGPTALAHDGKPHSRKLRSAPSVQTTLNLSSRAAFSECRLCDTVWNPSYADDVRYHKKRHAAVLKRRQIGGSTGPRTQE